MIVLYLYLYLKEKILYAQVFFVNGFIVGFFDKHLQWHKQIFPKAKRTDFCTVDIVVNLYHIYCDPDIMKENWRTQNCMAPFVHTYPAVAQYKIDEMVSDFLK